MAARRTRSISAKVTEAEYARLVAEAGDRTVSEWVRTVILETDAPDRQTRHASILLAELLALRMILLNLIFPMTRGEALTADAVQRLIDLADREKNQHARERLDVTRSES
jgi:hypothetical protein